MQPRSGSWQERSVRLHLTEVLKNGPQVDDLIRMAPGVGIEPTTNGLTVRRSTAELPGNTGGNRRPRIVREAPGSVKETPSPHRLRRRHLHLHRFGEQLGAE